MRALNLAASMMWRSCQPVLMASTPSCAETENTRRRSCTSTSLALTVTVKPGGVAAVCEKSTWVPTVCSRGQSRYGLHQFEAGPLHQADHEAGGEHLRHVLERRRLGIKRRYRLGVGDLEAELALDAGSQSFLHGAPPRFLRRARIARATRDPGARPSCAADLFPGIDQAVEVDAGLDAEPVQHVDHVLGGDVARGAGR